jgi:CRP/FNR family transcriptional regulator, cyclic AMP receptor protein
MGYKGFDSAMFLSKVGAENALVECVAGQVLFVQDDPADAVYYIQRGKVKMTVLSERGKEAVVALLAVGSFFGEECLNGQSRRLATATALTGAAILRIPKEEMVHVLRTEPAVASQFMSHLLQRNSRLEEDLVDQLFNFSEKRLARVLVMLANFTKDHDPEPIHPRLTQEVLAEMVGTTRSRVSFFMNKFRKAGFIEYSDTLKVNESLLNAVLRD